MKPFYFAKRKLQLVPAATILVALAISIPLSAQTITTFDAPGAGTGLRQGTYALCINPSGTIIGFVRGANEVRHGFVRSQDGSFIIFDAPGAGTAAGQGTRAYSINPGGTITGFFSDSVQYGPRLRSLQSRCDYRFRCAGCGHWARSGHLSS
jgi:hypothetical protein